MQAKRIRGSRWQPPSDGLLLASVDRAHRHRFSQESAGPMLSDIAAHLGIPWGSVASRRLRPLVDRLTDELGWLDRARQARRDRWTLSDAGARRLAQAEADGILEDLPESPQHLEWRLAREHAAARIDALRHDLREHLAGVASLLDADSPAAAADWLDSAKPLCEIIQAVAVASYCLHERPEPDDATADRDTSLEPITLRRWRHPGMWDPGHAE
jgi:hypothetical protein